MLQMIGAGACLLATLAGPAIERHDAVDDTLVVEIAAQTLHHLPVRLPDSWVWGDPVFVLDAPAPSVEAIGLAWSIAVVRTDPLQPGAIDAPALATIGASLGGGPVAWLDAGPTGTRPVLRAMLPAVDAAGPSTQAWFEGALTAALCGGG